MSSTLPALSLLLALTASPGDYWGGERPESHPGYRKVIQRVVKMPHDADLQARVRRHGLNVVNVMWEDTGRAAGSVLGPNISDVTLQVRQRVRGRLTTHLLPVIRFPNFSDTTADVKADKLWVRVGNHRSTRGQDLRPIRLTEVLSNLRAYLSDPSSLRGSGNFLAPRDTHFLVSAQHVFVPVPRGGKAEFNPVIFNYQSSPGSPAVLTLLVSRQGLSATVIENRPGDQTLQGWGQQLFHNNNGQRTAFTAERRSDVKARIESGRAQAQDHGALEQGADMMMLVQIPLKHKQRGYLPGLAGSTQDEMLYPSEAPSAASGAAPSAKPSIKSKSARSAERGGARSDIESAVIGHGRDLGPAQEANRLALVRDPNFPIRVTVQFYRATSNGVVSDANLADVARMIKRVYDDGDFVGSLVVPQGGRHRPTDWIANPPRRTWMPWGPHPGHSVYVQ